MQQTLLKSQLQPPDKRLTDSCACTHALSAPPSAPLHRSWGVHKSTASVVTVGHEARSLSERRPESGAVALLFAWVKVSHLVPDVSASPLEHMWHHFFFSSLSPPRWEEQNGPPFIVSRLRSNQLSEKHSDFTEKFRGCKSAFLVWNELAENSMISGLFHISSCH